jgi:hypothetical protein
MVARVKEKIAAVRKRYQREIPVASFFAGVLIDITTLNRIDSKLTLSMQCLFLVVTAILVYWEALRYIQNRLGKGGFLWENHTTVLHFAFGSLLSGFSVFYAKSASFWTSAAYMILISGLLIANEFTWFRKRGLVLRFALFSICISSYLNYVIPIFFGKIGVVPFALAEIATLSVVGCLGAILVGRTKQTPIVWKMAFLPASAVQVIVTILYLVNAIPPVPISLKHFGIYHDIHKSEAGYVLSYSRDPWHFWESGAQTFLSRPGDKIVAFAQIFSPPNFSDRIRFRWDYFDPNTGWHTSDIVPMQQFGGRERGFRGYSIKLNFFPGDWRVLVETSDDREIGRVHFTVVEDLATNEREMITETY